MCAFSWHIKDKSDAIYSVICGKELHINDKITSPQVFMQDLLH